MTNNENTRGLGIKMYILTKRKVMESACNNKKYCFDIIFEWEDILSKGLEVNIIYRSRAEFSFDEKCRKLYRIIHMPLYRLFNIFDKNRGNAIIMFDASTKRQDGIYNHKKYIPCLIDYFLDDKSYSLFLKAYSRNQMVLVSSREVYDYLKSKNCPLKIYHFPLSLPDSFKAPTKIEKKYDLVMFARQNPLLVEYINRYEKENPDFVLVRRKYEGGHYIYYLSSSGETVSICDTREEYFNLVMSSRIAVYTTPGMDGTRTDANGWNQVTPHFLEEVAGMCHIIARYPKNADTEWYEIGKICKCVESYEEFSHMVDCYRKEEVDTEKYKKFIEKHYTSKRVKLLKEILHENGIM